jgi:hypothetical protein
MEERKRRFNIREDVFPAVRERVQRSLTSGVFTGVHVFTPSGDVSDDYGLRLVALPPDAAFSRTGHSQAVERATEILKNRGDQPRQKQNRLIFIAADQDSVSRLEDQTRSLLAWQSIVTDVKETRLNLDQLQAKQAAKNCDDAGEALKRMVRETYKWLLVPMQEAQPGKGISEIQWESFQISSSAQNFTQEIERVLRDNELLITEWSPVHLANLLKPWFWKDDVKDAGAMDVWQKTCHYLYMPRLRDDNVFRSTLAAGAGSRDFFGFAYGKNDDDYVGFSYGNPAPPILDSALLLIEPAAASDYEVILRAKQEPGPIMPPGPIPPPSDLGGKRGGEGIAPPITDPKQPLVRRSFYANAEIDPVKAKIDFAQIVDEVLLQLTERQDVKVTIGIEIRAEAEKGFDDHLQRVMKENCKVLRFKNAEFE